MSTSLFRQASGMEAPNPDRDALGVIFDMEDDVRSTRDLIRALMVMAEHGGGAGLDPDECDAMNRVAGRALRAAEDVKKAWERVFELMKG